MSEELLTSRSILFQGSDAGFSAFCVALGIQEQNTFLDRRPENYDHMERRENHLEGGAIQGDFRYSFDVFLWDRTEDQLFEILDKLSSRGMSMATDTPETGPTPFDLTLFHNGQRIACEVMDDEIVQETYIEAPKWVRKELAALV